MFHVEQLTGSPTNELGSHSLLELNKQVVIANP